MLLLPQLLSDFTTKATAARSGGKTSSVMNTLKEALRPNDARQPVEKAAASDTTHDGRHGGIIETMKPGNQDYDAREKSGASGGGGGPVTDTIKEALGRNGSPSGTSQDRTNTETTEKNYSHGELPSTGSPKGTFSKGSEIHDRATPRVSAFDSQGTVGHQFTVSSVPKPQDNWHERIGC